MRDKHKNADSLSNKTEFYERLEQMQANQAKSGKDSRCWIKRLMKHFPRRDGWKSGEGWTSGVIGQVNTLEYQWRRPQK